MFWEQVLSEEDFRLYRENISLLEEQVIHHFPEAYEAPDIMKAIRSVPRHLFVHPEYRYLAYTDNAFPTYGGLTTSAPSVIAEMVYRSGINRGERLLEIGTGTGYEAAVLAEMGVNVFTIEIDQTVAAAANTILSSLGYKIDRTKRAGPTKDAAEKVYRSLHRMFPHRGRIELFSGNGTAGLSEHAPYRAIVVAAAVRQLDDISVLRLQLADRGRLLFLFGSRTSQQLHILERRSGTFKTTTLEGISFSFVPLVRSS